MRERVRDGRNAHTRGATVRFFLKTSLSLSSSLSTLTTLVQGNLKALKHGIFSTLLCFYKSCTVAQNHSLELRHDKKLSKQSSFSLDSTRLVGYIIF